MKASVPQEAVLGRVGLVPVPNLTVLLKSALVKMWLTVNEWNSVCVCVCFGGVGRMGEGSQAFSICRVAEWRADWDSLFSRQAVGSFLTQCWGRCCSVSHWLGLSQSHQWCWWICALNTWMLPGGLKTPKNHTHLTERPLSDAYSGPWW